MTAQTKIISKYGEPGPEYQAKYCELWLVQLDFPWFPAKRIFINKDFKEALFKAFTGIEQANLQEEIETFDGCYVERKVRGSSKISLHSWALAIDLNAHKEKLGQEATHWSEQFISIMEQAGVYWGGNFKTRKDNMHFGLYPG